MRSTVWVVDPALGRSRADAIAASLGAQGVEAAVHEFNDGPAVVIDDAPAGLERAAGVVRAATVELPGDAGSWWTRGLRDFLSRPAEPSRPLFLDLGRLTAFVFGVLGVTGLVLALHYRPSPDGAFASLAELTDTAGLGWFARSLHRVAAHVLVALSALSVLRFFFMRRFLAPHGRAAWRIAVGFAFVCVALLVTGELLPWNQAASSQTVSNTGHLARIPIVGGWLADVVRGGSAVTGATVVRMYAVHALLLPWVAFGLLLAARRIARKAGRS